MDILCILHDSDEYGVCRWPLADLARAAGVSVKLARELADKAVLKGGDADVPAFVYTPRHAGQDGQPVTLLAASAGPLWYCSRFVRDEYVRSRRGSETRFESPPKAKPKPSPKGGIGDAEGDGPSSSSSTSSALPLDEANASSVAGAPAPPPCPHERIIALYHEILPANPRIREWTPARAIRLTGLWRSRFAKGKFKTQDGGIEHFRRFFAYCSESKFLTGNATPRAGHPPFVASLPWLIKPENYTKVLEGEYHREVTHA